MLEVHWGGWIMSTRLPLGKKLTHTMLNRVAGERMLLRTRGASIVSLLWLPDRCRLLFNKKQDRLEKHNHFHLVSTCGSVTSPGLVGL